MLIEERPGDRKEDEMIVQPIIDTDENGCYRTYGIVVSFGNYEKPLIGLTLEQARNLCEELMDALGIPSGRRPFGPYEVL
jgi:hypothetical protein